MFGTEGGEGELEYPPPSQDKRFKVLDGDMHAHYGLTIYTYITICYINSFLDNSTI